MYIVNATEFQNNFGKYLQIVQNGGEVVILKNGREKLQDLYQPRAAHRFLQTL